ncbi:MAG: type II toxin-antitoxin system prevent-host-death family antitoxin [Treponema sp.]
MDMVLTANQLKVQGVTAIDEAVAENGSAIISIRGTEKYVVMKIEDYDKLRELELDAAIKESKKDIASGKFHSDGIEKHMKRVLGV